MTATHKKIIFKYYSDYLQDTITETMWAEIIDLEKGHFKLDNIPFFGPLIATGDLFYAEKEADDNRFVYKKTIQNSGNSIVQVIILEKDFDTEVIREKLQVVQCVSEVLNEIFFAVEITKEVDYSIVKTILTEFETLSILQFAEPCLSEKHRTDLLKN